MTLVELIVAIGILSVVMSGMTFFLSKILRAHAFIYQSNQSSFTASRGLEEVVDLVRNARTGADGSFPISQATSTEFSFFADPDQDGRIERIHIFYDQASSPKAIRYGITEPTTSTPPVYPSGDQAIYTVANFVVNGVSDPVFTYFNRSNAALSSSPTVSDVRMVQLSILVNANQYASSTVEISSFVSLRNLWGK